MIGAQIKSFLIALLSLCCMLLAAPLMASPQPEGAILGDPIRDVFDIPSQTTGSTYRIDVALPNAYRIATNQRYPVIYVLDGQWLFPTASWVATGGLFDRSLPPAIVIGISWKAPHDVMLGDRFRDFAPFPMLAAPTAGQAASFRRFLREELIPRIQKKYRAGPTRALVGLSLGGLFTFDTFVSEPDLFDIYVCDSPSLSFDDGSLKRRFDGLPKNFLHKPTRLLFSWGGAEALAGGIQSAGRELEARRFDLLKLRAGPVGEVGHAVSGVEAIAEGLTFGFSRDAIPLTDASAREYAGNYSANDGKFTTQINAAGNLLTIDFDDFGVPAKAVPLKQVGKDHLLAEANFIEVWIRRNETQKIDGADIVVEGTPMRLRRLDRRSGSTLP